MNTGNELGTQELSKLVEINLPAWCVEYRQDGALLRKVMFAETAERARERFRVLHPRAEIVEVL